MLQKPGEKPALLMTVTALGDRFSPLNYIMIFKKSSKPGVVFKSFESNSSFTEHYIYL